ncbi:hypothetical protein CVT25_003808 [Psilocybe cyanescens]|uniref:Uncharacterized protein n=1 Tax=Psilocybe cyanescens TaxID=93625 RepID=A0A409WX54_PSICY|nr:hypothetical protein CVT25_003808 [Psilocybe cyanescens]
MDIVDILALDNEQKTSESYITPLSSEGPHDTVNALEETLKRLRLRIMESRRTVRATATDVFEFQTELAKEISYHSQVIRLMADTIRRVAAHRNETSKSSFLWDSQKIVSDAPSEYVESSRVTSPSINQLGTRPARPEFDTVLPSTHNILPGNPITHHTSPTTETEQRSQEQRLDIYADSHGKLLSTPLALNDEQQMTESCISLISSNGSHGTVNALEVTLKRLRQRIVESQRTVRAACADLAQTQAQLAQEASYHSRVSGLMADTIDDSSITIHTSKTAAEPERLSLKRDRDVFDNSQDKVLDGFRTQGIFYDTFVVHLPKKRRLWLDDNQSTSPQEATNTVNTTLWRNYPSDRESCDTESSYSLSSVVEQDLTGDDLLEYSDDASDSPWRDTNSSFSPFDSGMDTDQLRLYIRKRRSHKRNLTSLTFPIYPMDEAIGGPLDSGLSTDNSEKDHHDISTLLRRWPPIWSDSLGHYRANSKYSMIGDDEDLYRPGHLDKQTRTITYYRAGPGENFWREMGFDSYIEKARTMPDWDNCDVDARIKDMFLSDRYVYTFDDQEWEYFE